MHAVCLLVRIYVSQHTVIYTGVCEVSKEQMSITTTRVLCSFQNLRLGPSKPELTERYPRVRQSGPGEIQLSGLCVCVRLCSIGMYILSFMPPRRKCGVSVSQSASPSTVILGLPCLFSKYCILGSFQLSAHAALENTQRTERAPPPKNETKPHRVRIERRMRWVYVFWRYLRPGGSSTWIRHCGFDPINGPYLVSPVFGSCTSIAA